METPSQKTRKFDIQRGVILAVLIFLGLAWIYLLHADQQAFFFRGLGQAFALFLTIFLGILLTIYLLISKGWKHYEHDNRIPAPFRAPTIMPLFSFLVIVIGSWPSGST